MQQYKRITSRRPRMYKCDMRPPARISPAQPHQQGRDNKGNKTRGWLPAGCVRAGSPPDGLAQQVGHREHCEARELAVRRHWDGVGHDHFLEDAAGQALPSGRAENSVGAARVHFPCSLSMQHLQPRMELFRLQSSEREQTHCASPMSALRSLLGLPGVAPGGLVLGSQQSSDDSKHL